MREGIPSATSFLVAFARGVGDSPVARAALRTLSFGMVDHIVLRTAAIDAYLNEYVAEGGEQVVILGAGLDARAWRLDCLASSTVYEIDHPATQRYKRERVRNMSPIASVRFIDVNFERESFSDRLRQTDYDAGKPTAWIWEGVTMYLPVEAVRDSLAELTELSAPGSFMMMTYREPSGFPFGALGRAAVPAVFRAAGEPLKAAFWRREIPGLLGSLWNVLGDEDSRGWRALSGSTAKPSENFRSERLVVAKRQEIT